MLTRLNIDEAHEAGAWHNTLYRRHVNQQANRCTRRTTAAAAQPFPLHQQPEEVRCERQTLGGADCQGDAGHQAEDQAAMSTRLLVHGLPQVRSPFQDASRFLRYDSQILIEPDTASSGMQDCS